MSKIEIKEINKPSDLKKFVNFPLELYQNNSFYVPPILSDELKNFDEKENPAFEFSKVKCFLAFKDDKIVGRVAAIINENDEKLLNDKKLRFGWFDFIEDFAVCEALVTKLKEVAKENNIYKLDGPVGFTNLDKAGMLTFGFEEVATLIGLYNFEYYPKFLEKLNFKPNLHWLESKILFDFQLPEKVFKFSEIAKE